MTMLSYPRQGWHAVILQAAKFAACLSFAGWWPVLAQVAVPPSPAASQSGAGGGDSVVALSVFEVAEDRDEGYRSTQTLSGSRTLGNLRDTPNSISVINRELIEDLIAVDVGELSFYSVTGEINTNTESQGFGAGHVFRGITANIALRDGVTWFVPVDTYNIDRVEVLRGPTAFLYGEGSAGGLVNQITKQAGRKDFQRVTFVTGSYDLYRGELDVNRHLSKTLAVRAALAYQKGNTFQNYASRDFRAAFLTFNYRPFRNTNINLGGEYGRRYSIVGANMLADQFSTTERTGATTAYTATIGGQTFVPALGQIYNTTGSRRSSGTGIVLADQSILPKEFSFPGPDAYLDIKYGATTLTVDQKVGENFNLQATGTFQKAYRKARTKAGSSQTGVFRDTNPTLPNGTPNPYFNQYYTEFYHSEFLHDEPMHNWRVTGVYDLKLPYTTQRIVGSIMYHDSEPNNRTYSEVVDPASASFTGTLNNANTLAAYQANNTVINTNRFYRRFYLGDGDGAELTKGGVIPGRSVILRNAAADGGSGRLTDRLYKSPAYGIGASGTYFKGRLHSLVGWRRSSFNQDPGRDFYNYVSGETYRLASTIPVHTRITVDSINYGGVIHLAKFVSAYFNYAESAALSSGIGGALLTPNTVRGPQTGDGNEYGLRWSFFGGRIESNWTYYITNALKQAVNPAIPAAVRQTELGSLFTDIDPAGSDTQATKATGIEFETVANPTKNWRLTWNFSTNELETSDRYPALRSFQARAQAQNLPIPDTEAFLATVPDGTPIPGFTKIRSNLVTNYRFTSGPLANFSIGGGAQYRDKSYQGNFDLNRDGSAEELWSPGYILWNLSLGYRTRILNREVNFTANINNITDKTYYRSFSLASGAWGDGRNFRVSARINL